jgi:hypothetical protein
MPTPTYTALANFTLANNASSVTFNSIPNTYRDLMVIYNGQTVDSGNFDIIIRLNADPNNHTFVAMGGGGSSTYSYTATTPNTFNPGAGNRTSGIFQIMDYSATDKHKTTLIRVDVPNFNVGAGVQRWASFSAVSILFLGIGQGTYAAGSTFALYGIAS